MPSSIGKPRSRITASKDSARPDAAHRGRCRRCQRRSLPRPCPARSCTRNVGSSSTSRILMNRRSLDLPFMAAPCWPHRCAGSILALVVEHLRGARVELQFAQLTIGLQQLHFIAPASVIALQLDFQHLVPGACVAVSAAPAAAAAPRRPARQPAHAHGRRDRRPRPEPPARQAKSSPPRLRVRASAATRHARGQTMGGSAPWPIVGRRS